MEAQTKGMTEEQLQAAVKDGIQNLGRPAPTPVGAPAMPANMQAAAEQMRNNPGMMKQASEMMKNMDPDVMAKMLAAQAPGVTPEMAKMSAQMMANMSEEDMTRMMDMAAKMGGGGMGMPPGMGNLGAAQGAPAGMRAAGGGAPMPQMGPGGMPQLTPEMTKQMSEMMKDPEMIKNMSGEAPRNSRDDAC